MFDVLRSDAIRSILWRVGRRLYKYARRDVPNSPKTNGEYWLVDLALSANVSPGRVLFDIGANVGEWSYYVAHRWQDAARAPRVFAFEPSEGSFSRLQERFVNSKVVTCHKLALTDRSGDADFYVAGSTAGTNSLFPSGTAARVTVATSTFDEFVENQRIESVLFVKSDTEGADYNVLLGASKSLRRGIIGLWQFEYNHRWLLSGRRLRDVFELVKDKPYKVGKLYGDGVELIERWHEELEKYFEGNYVLVNTNCAIYRSWPVLEVNERNVLARIDSTK